MKRLIDLELKKWKDDPDRKALLLRGARQVGKTYAVRELGKSFESFVEINFESMKEMRNLFEKDLDPQRVILELEAETRKAITPGQTLLFFDEVQLVPDAITALRYFYEKMPELHVIAAGSLLDFAIQHVGVPVGRVQFLYMYPMSLIEFLVATEGGLLAKEILMKDSIAPLSNIIHNKLLEAVAEYLAIGGMPEVVKKWRDTKEIVQCAQKHNVLVNSYRQDFDKYAKKTQVPYVSKLFDEIPTQLGKRFKYSDIEGEYRKRELSPALDLLVTAGVEHKVVHTSAQGIPLGAQTDLGVFKLIFLDVALSQTLLHLNVGEWLFRSESNLINKGSIVEAFVGQELLAYSPPNQKSQLYFWARETRTSQAEVDYVVQQEGKVVPIEVKSGHGSTLKSMHSFLESHDASPYGVRFSAQNYSEFERIKSYPLYAVAQFAIEDKEAALQALGI